MRTFLALMVFAASLSSGCDHIPEQLEEREVHLKERLAIEHYNKVVPESWPSQNAWVSALATASNMKSPAEIGQAYEKYVIPALADYQNLLAGMPVMSEDLKAIHATMLEAHEQLAKAFGTFASGLDIDNYKARRAQLAIAVSEFNSAERTYMSKLEAHFDTHGVARLGDPPVRIAKVDMDL